MQVGGVGSVGSVGGVGGVDVRVVRLSQDWRLASSMGKKQLGSQQMMNSPWQRAPESSACEVRGAVVLFRCMAALAMVQDLLGRTTERRWSGFGWELRVATGSLIVLGAESRVKASPMPEKGSWR